MTLPAPSPGQFWLREIDTADPAAPPSGPKGLAVPIKAHSVAAFVLREGENG